MKKVRGQIAEVKTPAAFHVSKTARRAALGMEAGITDHLWGIEELIRLIGADQAAA